jgi:hypothetical protein
LCFLYLFNMCHLMELLYPKSISMPKQTILEAEGEAAKA